MIPSLYLIEDRRSVNSDQKENKLFVDLLSCNSINLASTPAPKIRIKILSYGDGSQQWSISSSIHPN